MQYVDLPAPKEITILSAIAIAALPTHLQKLYAHDLVTKSLAENKGLRPRECPKCHESPGRSIHAHHDNYTLPLRVRFLCPTCHRTFHGVEADIVIITDSGKRRRVNRAPRLSNSVAGYIIPGDTDLDDNCALFLMGTKFK